MTKDITSETSLPGKVKESYDFSPHIVFQSEEEAEGKEKEGGGGGNEWKCSLEERSGNVLSFEF